jgi:hypothetical protein
VLRCKHTNGYIKTITDYHSYTSTTVCLTVAVAIWYPHFLPVLTSSFCYGRPAGNQNRDGTKQDKERRNDSLLYSIFNLLLTLSLCSTVYQPVMSRRATDKPSTGTTQHSTTAFALAHVYLSSNCRACYPYYWLFIHHICVRLLL